MKKLFTLLWLAIAAFAIKSTAQTTNCNAEFATQFITSNTVKFNPVITSTSPAVSHYWYFGDGSAVDSSVSPTHTFTSSGTYAVIHTIVIRNNNGAPVCSNSFTKQVTISTPCNLQVNFAWGNTTVSPLTIVFQNLTIPLSPTDSVTWDFGDGHSSHQANPTHTYANAGSYTVCLTVKKNPNTTAAPCIRTICKTVVVQAPCNIVPGFNWTATTSNPLRIVFQNTSTNTALTDSVRWTFGDGSSSNQYNPVHTYNAPGTYTVCLKIIRYNNTSTTPCIREICKTIVVHPACNLVVDFSSQPDPNHPLRIKFTNLSSPVNAADSVSWNFGDGSVIRGVMGDPNMANPTHNYTQAGNYVVCLRIKKMLTTTPVPCVKEKCETIIVRPPCNFVVDFKWRLDSSNIRKVHFTNLTNSPAASAIGVWSFGDGTTATSWNAVHEYAQPGRYIVCLRVYLGPNSANCVKEKCDTIYIPHPIPACTELSKFKFEKFSNDNQKYKFKPDYINPNLQYTWTFGDGNGSRNPVAVHRYAQPGVYTACLTVWRGPNCASTTCKVITVRPQPNCDSSHVHFSYMRFLNMPNKFKFTAGGTMPIIDQVWKFTKLGAATTPPVILHEDDPIYIFRDTGYYQVCLKATMLGGCVKEFCKVLKIEQVSNACVLQVFPNPAATTINASVFLNQPEMIHSYVYNSQQVLVLDKHQQGVVGNNLVHLNISNLPAGQYHIKIIYGNQVCHGSFQKL